MPLSSQKQANKTNHFPHPGLNRLVISLALLLAVSVTAFAQEATRHYRIPPQPLNSALMALANDAQLELVYRADKVRGLSSNGLDGNMTATQALGKLLQGSGLTYRYLNAHSITLEPQPGYFRKTATTPEQPQTSNGGTGEGHMMPKVTVEAESDNPYDDPTWATDPNNTDYNRPNATTATKTDTPIMETPVNVQVVPQQVLRDQQAVQIDKALQNVSGVYGQNSDAGFQGIFNLRGFDTFDYYRNGVRVFNGGSIPYREVANVERVEVLKGPASMLYGRIEPGGLINLVTKQPLNTPFHAFEQQFGSFDYYRTTVDSTGPLTQNKDILYRFNLAYENEGSYTDFLDKERVFLAPTFRWVISPKTEVNGYLEYQHSNSGITIFNIPLLGNRAGPLKLGSNAGEPNSRSVADDVRVGFNWSHAFNDQWTLRHRFDANFVDFPEGLVFLPTGFRDGVCTSTRCVIDRTAQDVPVNESQYYYTTIDLTGKFDTFGLHHTVLLGGDYWREHNLQRFVSYNAPSINVIDFRPVHTRIPNFTTNDLTFAGQGTTDADWYGFFMQDQIKLPFGVQALAGFRYDNAGSAFDFVDNTPGAGNARDQDSFREDALKPRFGLLWQPIKQVSVYGNYVENFGLSQGRGVDRLLPPTTAQQYEAGIKTELLDGRLTGTVAFFDLTKQNLATPHPDRQLAARGIQVTTGEARNRGVELDISGEVLPGLRAIGNYAYIDSAITKDVGLVFDQNGETIGTNAGNTGHRFPNVPRHGGSFWVTYEPIEGALYGWKMGAGIVARSQRQYNLDNTAQVPGYAIVNLMAGYNWKVNTSKISAQLSVDNLLDKHYNDGADFAQPLTILGSLRVEF
jgi:iron complex outermembrane recepter protein